MGRPALLELSPLELGLYALCWVATLAIGSVHPPTQVALGWAGLVLVIGLALGPSRKQGIRLPPLAWVSIAALAWTALQLVPLPLSVLGALSPSAAELRAEVGARWAPITLDVAATSLELAKQLTYLSVLLVGAELLRRRAAIRAAAALALLGALVAALFAGHRLLGAERIYGVYTLRSHPGVGFFAPFVNGNHAASVLALGALAAAGVARVAGSMGRAVFWLVAGAAALATLGTTSRGGAIGLAVGAVVLVLQLSIAHLGARRGVALAVVLMGALGTGALVIADGLRTRFTEHMVGDSLTENQKTRGWLAALRLARAYPLVGVGRGAFEAPSAQVRPVDEGVRLVYPENVVCQWVSEWGYPVGLGLLVACCVVFVRTVLRLRFSAPLAGLSAGVIAVSVHELFDFGLEFPGVALPLTLALAAIVGQSEEDDRAARRRARPRLRMAALVASLLAAATGLGLATRAVGHTLERELTVLRAAAGARDAGVADAIGEALLRHPASAELEVLAGEEALRRRDPGALRHLSRAMRLHPAGWRAHQLAAIALLRARKLPQAALELRLAMERGAGTSMADLVDLVGAHAVDAVPREVEAYLRLAAEYARLARWQDVERAYRRAAELDPGPGPRARWLALLPGEHALAAAEELAQKGTSGEELALAVSGFAAAKRPERAAALLTEAIARYPSSAALVVAGARYHAARGDLDAARELIGRTSRFDRPGQIVIEELRVELADKAGDREAALAAKARLRILRRRADLDEPTRPGVTK